MTNTIGQAKRELKELLGATPKGYGLEVAYDKNIDGEEVIDLYLHATDYKGHSLEEASLRTYPISEEKKALAYANRLDYIRL